MFVSINWIKDYVDLDGLDVKQLIEGFTLSTAEEFANDRILLS